MNPENFNMKKLLIFPILVVPILLTSLVLAQTAPVQVTTDHIVKVGTVVCGFVDKWIPGRLVSDTAFLPTKYEIRKLNKRISSLQDISLKRTSLLRIARALKRTYRSESVICSDISTLPASVTATPTWNPAAGGGVIGGGFRPTSTPIKTTVVGTATITPNVSPTIPPVLTTTVSPSGPTATPTVTATVAVTETPAPEITDLEALNGFSIFSNDGTFLGIISTNKFSDTSIANSNGTYGSKFGSLSIFNSSGNYGSTTAMLSAFNKTATSPPSISDGTDTIGLLTLNAGASSGRYVNACKLATVVGRSVDVAGRCP